VTKSWSLPRTKKKKKNADLYLTRVNGNLENKETELVLAFLFISGTRVTRLCGIFAYWVIVSFGQFF
jgi:hypothetical protein